MKTSINTVKTCARVYVSDNTTIKWCGDDGGEYLLHIQQDEMADDPREMEYMNDGIIMACFHNRYKLGDKLDVTEPEEFWQSLVNELVPEQEIWNRLKNGDIEGATLVWCKQGERERYYLDEFTVEQCMELLNDYIEYSPLWLYDHSGISISCGIRKYPYNDRWDSGCVGWIVTVKDKFIRAGFADADNWREKAKGRMASEVEVYDYWLQGLNYGYTLYERDEAGNGWHELESIWGFYGDEIVGNGICDSVELGLREAIENEMYETGKATVVRTTRYVFD